MISNFVFFVQLLGLETFQFRSSGGQHFLRNVRKSSIRKSTPFKSCPVQKIVASKKIQFCVQTYFTANSSKKNPKGVAETQQKRPIFLFPFSRHTNTHAKREREIEISFVTKKKIFGGSETRKFQKYWQNIFFLLLLFFVEAVSWILKFRDEEKT